MYLHVTKSEDDLIFRIKRYICENPIPDSYGSIRCVQNALLEGDNDLWSVVELKHDRDLKRENPKRFMYDSIFLLINSTDKLIHDVRGFGRGYIGEGARAAMTMDAYTLLLNIPTLSVVASVKPLKEALENKNSPKISLQRIFETPKPAKLRFSFDNLGLLLKKEKKAEFEIDTSTGVGYDTLYNDMPLKEFLNALDYENHGRHRANY